MTDQEDRLWAAYRASRSIEDRNALIAVYLPLIEKAAGTYLAKLPPWSSKELGDLVNDCIPDLIALIERFEPSKNYLFWTFAARRIYGSMVDAIRDSDWVPRSERVQQKKDPGHPVISVFRAHDESEGRRWDETDPYSFPLPPAPSELSEADRDRWWADVCRGLDKPDRLILLMHYREQMTMKAIGAHIGCSESRVSQRMSSIRARLQARTDWDEFWEV